MSEANPHSVVVWIRLEKHERRSDGNLSGMPVEVKNCSGRIHLSDGEAATNKIDDLTQKFKSLIEKENNVGNSL